MAYTSLLLHCDGTNNSTTFTDSCLVPKTVTASGNAKISTAQSKFGVSSAAFDGSGDYLQLADSDYLAVSLYDWTLEAWIYYSGSLSSSNKYIAGKRGSSGTTREWVFYVNGTTGYLGLTMYNSSSSTILTLTGTTALTTNTWHHVAFVKKFDTVYIFLDGNLEASGTPSGTIDKTSTVLKFGYESNAGASSSWNGYMDEIRITQGAALYTANFTAPSAAFTIETPSSTVFTADVDGRYGDIGTYKLSGTVTELGVAGAYIVRLFDRLSGKCLQSTVSGADGSYTFNHLDYIPNGYFIVAYDHGDNPLNAAIADLATPELMS